MSKLPARRPRSLAPGLLVLAASSLGACTTIEEVQKPESTRFRGEAGRIEEVQPVDIAVAPVRNQSGRDDLPADQFREAFAAELLDRLYSPLSLDYVDANWAESAFAGTPAPDALLVVAITDWDPDHLYSSGIVTVGADLYLFEGGSTTGTPLWGLELRRRIDLGDGRGNPPTPSDHLRPKAVRLFAEAALAELPERDPLAVVEAR